MRGQYRKGVKIILLILTLLLATLSPCQVATAGNVYVPQYYMYNTKTKEHFFTISHEERNKLAKNGLWQYKGINCLVPKTSKKPVYRFRNKKSGLHYYTTDKKERKTYVKKGWKYEGIGWYSGGDKKVYQLYNTRSRTRQYTLSTSERKKLVKKGWEYEGVGWYGKSAKKYVDKAGAPPAAITNIVKNIKGTTKEDAYYFNKTFNKLPKKLRQEFVDNGWKIYVTDEDLEKYFPNTDAVTYYTVNGYISSVDKVIYVRDGTFGKTLVHEMGHFLDYQRDWPSYSDEFEQIAKDEKDAFRNATDTEHAIADDNSEFFADIFAYLIIDPDACTEQASKFVSKYL